MITPRLQHDTDSCAPGIVREIRIQTEHFDATRGATFQSGEHGDRRGLACTVRSEKSDNLSCTDFQIYAAEYVDVAVSHAQIFDADDRAFAMMGHWATSVGQSATIAPVSLCSKNGLAAGQLPSTASPPSLVRPERLVVGVQHDR